MIEPAVFKGVHPHAIDESSLIYSQGNRVYRATIENLKRREVLGYYSAGTLKTLSSHFDLSKRIGRLGFHDLRPVQNGLVGVQRKAIVYKENASRFFAEVFSGFRGSRPLGVFVHPYTDHLYFGEYFGNNDREAVHIYTSQNGRQWSKAWTFPAGSIRHVHGIVWDEYRNGMWVLTGDSDEESGLWFTRDNFKTLHKVVGRSQKARAVEIIPTRDGLIVPMDSPLEQNHIHFYNLATGQFEQVAKLPGSAFHATLSNEVYLVSTVTEPSEVNIVDFASVWASLDGKNWKEISRFRKDWFPVKYQFITRYAEVSFPSGINTSDYLIGYGQALKGKSSSILLWPRKEVIKFLT